MLAAAAMSSMCDSQAKQRPCPYGAAVTSRSAGRSVVRVVLVLFGLCLPIWVIGAIVDIELFPGFKLFQAGLATPMCASLVLIYREQGWTGIGALLRRTDDVSRISPTRWLLLILRCATGHSGCSGASGHRTTSNERSRSIDRTSPRRPPSPMCSWSRSSGGRRRLRGSDTRGGRFERFGEDQGHW